MKKSGITLLIGTFLFIIMIIVAYYFNGHTILCFGFDGTCRNYYIPNLGVISISIIGSFFPILMSFYRHYVMKEIEIEKFNHLKFLKTIREKEKDFDIIYFDDYNEAEKKFNLYKNGYILPIGYLYDISIFDLITRDEFAEKIISYPVKEFTIEQIDKIENGNDDDLSYVKKFIDLEEYIEKLRNKGLKTFNLKDEKIKEIFNENFIELISGKLSKFKLIRLLRDKDVFSFVLIKGYYLLYYKN